MTNTVMRDGVAHAHDLPRTPLRRKAAAQYIQAVHGQPCAPRTLAKLAASEGGPAYRRAGKVALYEPDDLDEWARARLSPKVRSYSELDARPAMTGEAHPSA